MLTQVIENEFIRLILLIVFFLISPFILFIMVYSFGFIAAGIFDVNFKILGFGLGLTFGVSGFFTIFYRLFQPYKNTSNKHFFYMRLWLKISLLATVLLVILAVISETSIQ